MGRATNANQRSLFLLPQAKLLGGTHLGSRELSDK